jgi:hypothetical protein
MILRRIDELTAVIEEMTSRIDTELPLSLMRLSTW